MKGWVRVNIEQIKKCIADDNLHAFYTCGAWIRLRAEVLNDDKTECQMCKAKGRYKKANHVHHVNYVRKHPELALSKTYVDDAGQTKRNLISVCKACHEELHDHRQKEKKEPLTPERW